MSNNFNESLDSLFSKMESFVSTKTVVGEAITIGGLVMLPLIEVSVGVGAGANTSKGTAGSGGGLGAKIIPSAVIVIHNGTVQLVNIKNQDAVSKLIDMAPGIAEKLNFSRIFGKKEGADAPKEPINTEETIILEK